MYRLATKHKPTYLIADMNTKSRILGYNSSNQVGKGLERFLRSGKLIHPGPQFPTFYSRTSSTTLDIVLSINKAIHNLTIDPGPITESDHTPVIVKLTTNAITKTIPPTLNIN